MNNTLLAKALRDKAGEITDAPDLEPSTFDTAELLIVLARIVEGNPIAKAFGAPGDWGYDTPIGAALAGKAE
jgi:hypothetical protein